MMEALIVLSYIGQAYLAYWSWTNLPPNAGMPDPYRYSKIAIIVLALLPFGIFYQLIAFGVAKFYASRMEKATQRLSAAPSSFGTARQEPTTSQPSANAGAGAGLPAGTNPFADSSPSIPPPAHSNPFADGPTAASSSDDEQAQEIPQRPPKSSDNPFL